MDTVRNICKNVSLNRVLTWINMPRYKLNTIKTQLGISDDEIILFYDSTLLGSGKVGLAICDNGIFWRNAFESPRYLSWKLFKKAQITTSDSYLYIGEENKIFVFNEDIDNLANILNLIRKAAKVDCAVEKTTGFFGFLEQAVNFIDEVGRIIEENSNEKIQSNQQIPVKENQILIEAPSTEKFVEVNEFKEIEEKKEWMIVAKDFKLGPLTTKEAKEWINTNYNKYKNLYAWKKGMEDWKLISEIEEFKELFIQENTMPPLPKFD